jgi:hypothetical protein
MKTIVAVLATTLAATMALPANGAAQTTQKASTFTIAGHPGEAKIVQIDGKSYVEIETLARLTQGTLSFKANQTILTLPPSDAGVQAPGSHPKAGLSTAFVRASIEELSVIREWRTAIVNAVQNNSPASEDWLAAQHRLAEKNLALASTAASTDDDRSASALLSAEFNNMQKLNDLYLAMRKQAAFISPDEFHNGPLEDQIQGCAQGFAAMTESHEFQDQTACH